MLIIIAAEINIEIFKFKIVIGIIKKINNIINHLGIKIFSNLSFMYDIFSYLKIKFLAKIKFNTKIIIQLEIIKEGINNNIFWSIIKLLLVSACMFS